MFVAAGLFAVYAGIRAWRDTDSFFVQMMIGTALTLGNPSRFGKALGLTQERIIATRLFMCRTLLPFNGACFILAGTWAFISDLHIGCKP
jgi:hypothetical protein